MSKAASFQFSGTKGQRISQGIVPSNQREMVTSWATAMAKYLQSKSNRKRDSFKTACVAFDENTGKLYYGRNKGINHEASNVDKNITLFGDSTHEGILPSRSLNGYPTPWNCAETDAINQALNDNAELCNIHIYTIDTTPNNFGKPKKSCRNCTYAYKGKIKKNNTGWEE